MDATLSKRSGGVRVEKKNRKIMHHISHGFETTTRKTSFANNCTLHGARARLQVLVQYSFGLSFVSSSKL